MFRQRGAEGLLTMDETSAWTGERVMSAEAFQHQFVLDLGAQRAGRTPPGCRANVATRAFECRAGEVEVGAKGECV